MILFTRAPTVLFMQMTQDTPPNHRLPRRGFRRRRGRIHLSTTIALVVLFALAVITISIGIAQADTLSQMVDDETGRLALVTLVVVTMAAGSITGVVMRLTAPRPGRRFSYIGFDPAYRSAGAVPSRLACAASIGSASMSTKAR